MKRISITLIPSFVIGALAFCLTMDVKIISPTYIDWLYSGDSITNYLGWVFYRNGPWTLPWGLNPDYGAGIGGSIVFSDSIPLLGMLFKPFSALLPTTFQYFGLWYFLCFLLQSFFAWKITSLWTQDFAEKVLITLVLVFSPAFLGLLGYFAALSAHFLILWALYIVLRGNNDSPFAWSFVLVISACTTFYIFAMVLVLWIGNITDRYLVQKQITFNNLAYEIITNISLIFFILWFCGYFSIIDFSVSASIKNTTGDGYGSAVHSLNVLSLIYSENWAGIFRILSIKLNIENGFNYIGMGIIFGILFLLFIKPDIKNRSKIFIKSNPFFISLLLFLTIFAITNHIRIGSYEVMYQIPTSYAAAASVLRTSSRLFWPVYYLIVLGIIFGVVCSNARYKKLILLIILVIQLIDIGPSIKLLSKNIGIKKESYFRNRLISNFWGAEQIGDYKNILRVPMMRFEYSWEVFGWYAAE